VALKLEDKKAIVAEAEEYAGSALSVIAADYRGLTVEEMTNLRVEARKSGKVRMRVFPNNLARIALKKTEFACLSESLVGPLFLAFSYEDPAAAARLLRDAGKKHENLKVKAIAISGKLLGPEGLDGVANLPTREQALSMLLSTLMGPITKLARTLAEPAAQLARVVAAVRDKQQSV
jgi:large subunit ribosomal protein L10